MVSYYGIIASFWILILASDTWALTSNYNFTLVWEDFGRKMLPDELITYLIHQNETEINANTLPPVGLDESNSTFVPGGIPPPQRNSHLKTGAPNLSKLGLERITEGMEEDYQMAFEVPHDMTGHSSTPGEKVTVEATKKENSLILRLAKSSKDIELMPLVEKVLHHLYEKEKESPSVAWVLGAMFQLPIGYEQCLETEINKLSKDDLKLIQVDLIATKRIQHDGSAHECTAIKETETKTVHPFGSWSREYTKEILQINITTCVDMLQKHVSPDGRRLEFIRWDYFGTNSTASTYYSWWRTNTASITNYYITYKKLTVDPIHSLISSQGVNLVLPCRFDEEFCKTEAGWLVWQTNSFYGPGHQNCKIINYKGESCILSRFFLQCLQSRIVITDMGVPFGCGKLIGYVRMAVSPRYAVKTAVETFQSDYVRYSATFSRLWEVTKEEGLEVLAFQLGLCQIREESSTGIKTKQDKDREAAEVKEARRTIQAKLDTKFNI